ncbi:hypothetical protein WDV93_16200 [Pantoea ananatis]
MEGRHLGLPAVAVSLNGQLHLRHCRGSDLCHS